MDLITFISDCILYHLQNFMFCLVYFSHFYMEIRSFNFLKPTSYKANFFLSLPIFIYLLYYQEVNCNYFYCSLAILAFICFYYTYLDHSPFFIFICHQDYFFLFQVIFLKIVFTFLPCLFIFSNCSNFYPIYDHNHFFMDLFIAYFCCPIFIFIFIFIFFIFISISILN